MLEDNPCLLITIAIQFPLIHFGYDAFLFFFDSYDLHLCMKSATWGVGSL